MSLKMMTIARLKYGFAWIVEKKEKLLSINESRLNMSKVNVGLIKPSVVDLSMNHTIANQCVVCGAEMPEGNHICNGCLNSRESFHARKTRIYIAGKISGLPIEEYTEKFNYAESRLEKDGHLILNPLKMVHQDLSYDEQMKICLRLVELCDVIYLLDNWRDSMGARREKQYAELLDKRIVFQEAE